jgi:hypothetical protein
MFKYASARQLRGVLELSFIASLKAIIALFQSWLLKYSLARSRHSSNVCARRGGGAQEKDGQSQQQGAIGTFHGVCSLFFWL